MPAQAKSSFVYPIKPMRKSANTLPEPLSQHATHVQGLATQRLGTSADAGADEEAGGLSSGDEVADRLHKSGKRPALVPQERVERQTPARRRIRPRPQVSYAGRSASPGRVSSSAASLQGPADHQVQSVEQDDADDDREDGEATPRPPKKRARLHKGRPPQTPALTSPGAAVASNEECTIRVSDDGNEGEHFVIREGHCVYVAYDAEQLRGEFADPNTLGIGIVRGITPSSHFHDTTLSIQWLYRVPEVKALNTRVRGIWQKEVGRWAGVFEMTLSEHFDTVGIDSLTEPPRLYLFDDAAADPAQSVTPLHAGGDNYQDEHILRISDFVKAPDAPCYYRVGFSDFSAGNGPLTRSLMLPRHCICGKPYRPAREMRRCSKCAMWFHEACLSAASRPPQHLVIRGGKFGVVGSFGLVPNGEPWRTEAYAPKDWLKRYAKTKQSAGRSCPRCKTVI